MFRTLALTAAAGGAGLALAACGGSSSATVSPSSAAAAAGSTAAASAPALSGPYGAASSAAPSSPAATGTAITATETEFKIAVSTSSVKAGTYTFTAKNAGHITHALSITGPGGVKASTGDIQPGSTGTMTVTLVAGSYDVFCPVADHKMLGMDSTLTVS